MRKTSPEPFKLHAGHPALELINTLDMRFSAQTIELLPTYADLLRFCVQLQMLTGQQARNLARTTPVTRAQQVLDATRELRETLASVLYSWADGEKPAAAQVEKLEHHFHKALLQRKLRPDGHQLEWTWNERGSEPELPLWKLAQAASDLLVSSDTEHIKDCGDPTCRWLFLDLSKNHTRRWCDMKVCGNRMKARRHQARRQDHAL